MLSTRDPPQNKRPAQMDRKKKKKAKVAILILDKIDFETKAIKGHTENTP